MAKDETLISIFNGSFKDSEPKKSKQKKPPAIKPSMLGSPCLRKVYYSYNQVEPDYGFPLKNKRIMKVGDYISQMITDIFRDQGIIIDYVNPDGTIPTFFGKENKEFPVESEVLGIKSGKIDGVVILNEKLWIVEIKSINSRGFSGGSTYDGTYIPPLSGPKPEHLIQGVTYFYLFNDNLKNGKYSHIKELDKYEKAEGVIFLYYNKDSSELKEFPIISADNVFSQIVSKIVHIMDSSKNKVLPPKTNDYCSTCPFRKKCENNFNDI